MAQSAVKTVNVGDQAPDFVLPSLDDKDVRLSDYRGKRLILFMWASWWACRDQLPVWQQFLENHQNVEILSVTLDAQGPDKARPYVEKANATFSTVVDSGNLLGELYGFKAIPNGFLIDEQGVVRYKRLGGFDIRRAETAEIVERWVNQATPEVEEPSYHDPPGNEHSQANAHFVNGLELYNQGRIEEALAEWRKGTRLEPDNWVIRKQIWAVENPDKFYSGDVDYDWQKEQIAKGL
jgi:peroxiredoxin